MAGNTTLSVVSLVCTLAVTLGIAFALFPSVERDAVFALNLVMLCLAEALVFAFPIRWGRASVDSRAPTFVFGFGLQVMLGVYLLGVALLCVLSGAGRVGYALVDQPAPVDIEMQGVVADGTADADRGFDGRQRDMLATNRSIAAGAVDRYDIRVLVKPSTAGAVGCDGTTTISAFQAVTRLRSGDDESAVVDCTTFDAKALKAPSQAEANQLVLTRRPGSVPVPVAAHPGVYEMKYVLEVRNTRWFMSPTTLAIAHAVWALLLVLVASAGRMGAETAGRIAAGAIDQRRAHQDIALRVASFAATVRRERTPETEPFVAAVLKLDDDVRYAAPETLPGTESYDAALLSGLERLGGDYAQLREQRKDAAPVAGRIGELTGQVQALVDLVAHRNAAVRAAR